jgi:5-methylcytosine-specific restriction enzyme subunit McrC
VGPSTQNQPGRFLQLKRALARLDGISSPIAGEFSPHSIARYLRRLPQYHEYYGEALLLSQLILEGAGLSIRATGALLALPSILIDMEKVFEAYARLILSRKISVEGIMYVRDGNKAGADGAKTTIFTHCQVSNNPSCTPDIVITNPECPTLIIDAKYKPSREIPDRSDLNQVVLYGARYSCSKVMVLFPERKKQEPSAKLLGTIGPVSIYTGYIDLGAPDIEAEEDRFASAIIDILR